MSILGTSAREAPRPPPPARGSTHTCVETLPGRRQAPRTPRGAERETFSDLCRRSFPFDTFEPLTWGRVVPVDRLRVLHLVGCESLVWPVVRP